MDGAYEINHPRGGFLLNQNKQDFEHETEYNSGGRWHFDTLCGHHGMLYPRGKKFCRKFGVRDIHRQMFL